MSATFEVGKLTTIRVRHRRQSAAFFGGTVISLLSQLEIELNGVHAAAPRLSEVGIGSVAFVQQVRFV